MYRALVLSQQQSPVCTALIQRGVPLICQLAAGLREMPRRPMPTKPRRERLLQLQHTFASSIGRSDPCEVRNERDARDVGVEEAKCHCRATRRSVLSSHAIARTRNETCMRARPKRPAGVLCSVHECIHAWIQIRCDRASSSNQAQGGLVPWDARVCFGWHALATRSIGWLAVDRIDCPSSLLFALLRLNRCKALKAENADTATTMQRISTRASCNVTCIAMQYDISCMLNIAVCSRESLLRAASPPRWHARAAERASIWTHFHDRCPERHETTHRVRHTVMLALH